VATNPFSTKSITAQTALIPKQEVLPALHMPERMNLQGMVEERSGRSFLGMIASVERDFRARQATTDFLDRVREQFFSATQARLEVELQGELAQMVETVRHAMTMLQLEHYALEQDFATKRTMELRFEAARQYKDFATHLVDLGYPEELIDRAIGNTVTNILSISGAEIATMGGINAFARAARPQSAGSERMGEPDAGVHSELR